MLRFIVFIFLLLCSFAATAQVPVQYLGTSNNRIAIRNQLKVDSVLLLPPLINIVSPTTVLGDGSNFTWQGFNKYAIGATDSIGFISSLGLYRFRNLQTAGAADTLVGVFDLNGNMKRVGKSTLGGSTDTASLSNRINLKVDSVTTQGDSLIYWKNGSSYYVTSLAAAAAGGDTTIFEIVLDSTGQQNNRVLFSKNRKISSDSRFLFDDVNDKLVLNGANISVGGANTKLWVGGNTNVTGTLTIGNAATSTDTTTYKPAIIGSDNILRRLTSWPTGGSSIDTTSLSNRINAKQDVLVSGTNIKTINGSSLLGSGNLTISGGGGSQSLQQTTDIGNTTNDNVIIGAHNTVNSDTAEVSPYKTFATGAANYGSAQYRWGISFDASLRVRQKGYVQYLKIYLDSVPVRLTSFYVTIWRKSATTAFNIVDSINILPYLQNGTNTIRLPKKLFAQDGDYVGWGYSSTASGSNFLYLPSFSGSEIGYYFNSDATHPVDGTAFVGLSSIGQYLPIVLYMESPSIIFIGDSKISGFDNAVSAYTQQATTVRGKSIPDLVSDSLGMTFQNMGIGNTTVNFTVNRFDRDVVDKKPKYAVIEIGVNSISLGLSTDSIMNDYRRILSKCTTNNIKPVIIKILPWTNGTNARNRQRDTINSLLVTEAANYNGIIIDCNTEVGQFRVGGDVGNLWDIQAAYTADGVHFTDLGYRVISSKVYQTLRTQLDTIFPSTPADGGAELQINSKDKGFALPIWTGYQRRYNDSLSFRFREGVMAYDDSTGAAFINKRKGFKEVVTLDYPRSGTNATRVAMVGVPAGTTFYQTDYFVGLWVYTGSAWRYQISDFVINREFEISSSNLFQAPSEWTAVSGGTMGSWFTSVTNMQYPVALGTGTNTNGGSILKNHNGGSNNLMPLSNKIYSTVINLSSFGALSDATNRYIIRFGAGNEITSISDAADFVGIRYCDTINSGAFQAYSRSGGSETTANTTVTVAMNTSYELTITHKGTSVEYWINGVLAATITTNIPTVGRGAYHSIFKTAGTTSKSVVLSGIKILKF